jgi:hypothetical protein
MILSMSPRAGNPGTADYVSISDLAHVLDPEDYRRLASCAFLTSLDGEPAVEAAYLEDLLETT